MTSGEEKKVLSIGELLEAISRRRRFRPADFGLADSTTLLREDRDR